ncbi:hypothetical protein KW787_01005 [Candidatus Pacearchaeota archaeon]|nr:hypothetical protein [Candidatus Pacearchaeota archaeon]
MDKQRRRFSSIQLILVSLDVLLAALIIIGSEKLRYTEFGKASLTFGLVMLGIVTILRLLQKW